MTRHRFSQLDVFGSVALDGNPLAVVHDADGLSTETMQAFARWTGLSETAFVSEPTDPTADYRVRIFTASQELPFAGHPTLGSAYAWLAAGGRPRGDTVIQQCAAALVPVRSAQDRLAFAAPPLTRFEPVAESLQERIAAGLGLVRTDLLDASWLVNGPEWIGIRLASAAQVLALRVDPATLTGLELGVVGPHPAGGGVRFEVRAFIPGDAVAEDPVTGSLNAGLAAWLIGSGQAPQRYVAAQGTVLGAAGRVHVEQEDDALWVGGRVVEIVVGTVDL